MIFDTTTPIEYLRLKTRTYNVLKRNGINTVNDVLQLTNENIECMMNIGTDTLQALKSKLQLYIEDPSCINSSDAAIYDDDVDIDRRVIYYIDSKTNSESYIVRFRTDCDQVVDDILIDLTPLSIRVRNCLRRAGLDSLLDVVNAPYSFIKAYKNMGEKSCEDLIQYLKKVCVIEYAKSAIVTIRCNEDDAGKHTLDEFISLLSNDINAVVSNAVSYDMIRNKLLSVESVFIEHASNYAHVSQLLTDIGLLSIIYSDPAFMTAVCNIALHVICTYASGVDEIMIERNLPKSYLAVHDYAEVMDILTDEGRVEIFNNRYIYMYESVSDYLSSISNTRWAAMITDRFSGMTLEEAARRHGVTRERVRQIVHKVMSRKPTVREDRYAYWFTRYNICKIDFIHIFDETVFVYNYLSEVYEKGRTSIGYMHSDALISDDIASKLQDVTGVETIKVFGELITSSMNSILRSLLKHKHSDEACHLDTIRQEYNIFCKEHGLRGSRYQACSSHVFDARLTRPELRYVLLSQGRLVRYYNMDAYDVKSLISSFDFDKYNNSVISARKLMMDNPDAMDSYDIHNEYELHNLLRKNLEYLPKNVQLCRMPLIEVGHTDRHAQVANLIQLYAPITQTDLAAMFYDLYGIDPVSFVSNWLNDFWSCYADGAYYTDPDKLTTYEIMSMRVLFKNSFYFIDDMISLYCSCHPEFDSARFNAFTLRQLGYNVYSNYVISTKYPSAGDYFRHIFDTKDVVDVSAIDPRMNNIQSLVLCASEYCKSYKFFEYEPKMYMSALNIINSVTGITIEDIESFCSEAMDMNCEYFNIRSLQRRGMDISAFNKLGASDWFFNALIRDHTDAYAYRQGVSSNMIFCRSKKFDMAEFITYLIDHLQNITMADFIVYVQDEYGLKLIPRYVQQCILKAGMYYDAATAMIFRSVADFTATHNL